MSRSERLLPVFTSDGYTVSQESVGEASEAQIYQHEPFVCLKIFGRHCPAEYRGDKIIVYPTRPITH